MDLKKTVNKKTSLGCMSYEYLKIIKQYQIENNGVHEVFYLFLLLFFACKLKTMLNGENLFLFNETFKKGNFPIPVECQKYAYNDHLNSIKKKEEITSYILTSPEDEIVIKYVCDNYGILSFNELLKKYRNDELVKNTKYWDDINFERFNLIDNKEKNILLKELKKQNI